MDGTPLSGLVQFLGDLESRALNSRPLALAVAATVEEDNRAARLAGVDRFGSPLEPVKSQKGRPGPGPPLAPRGAASRVVSGYVVNVQEVAPGTYRVTASWPGLDWLFYHTEGRGGLPVRDIEGIRESAWVRIRDEVRRFAEDLVRFRG